MSHLSNLEVQLAKSVMHAFPPHAALIMCELATPIHRMFTTSIAKAENLVTAALEVMSDNNYVDYTKGVSCPISAIYSEYQLAAIDRAASGNVRDTYSVIRLILANAYGVLRSLAVGEAYSALIQLQRAVDALHYAYKEYNDQVSATRLAHLVVYGFPHSQNFVLAVATDRIKLFHQAEAFRHDNQWHDVSEYPFNRQTHVATNPYQRFAEHLNQTK